MGKNPTVITEKPAGIFLKHSAIVRQAASPGQELTPAFPFVWL